MDPMILYDRIPVAPGRMVHLSKELLGTHAICGLTWLDMHHASIPRADRAEV